ncbi:uncharacterized protein BT62DRAFT_1000027 [Guyanagaster necrorhizus]|uniref:Uncharacterized protein n=1 Tax=Guyanagaster necrorhizus TaxID=856835 RepID=A0A9P7W5F6_9AGAR|nr:uncharacterized protein BT62DRAFT_1000027 [Guyanagaster necrorhizus MCA 3950]KAG7452280.1 hypothetical protein BT62DRAFT_1000027 [Guyanagaster necrorhizus MCA 3950]
MARSTCKRPMMTRARRALVRRALQLGTAVSSVLQEFNITEITLSRIINNFHNDDIEEDAWYLDGRNPNVSLSPKVHERKNLMRRTLRESTGTASHARPVRQSKHKLLGGKTNVLSAPDHSSEQESKRTPIVPLSASDDIPGTSLSHSHLSNDAPIPQSQPFAATHTASTADSVSLFLRHIGRDDLKAKFDKLEIRTRKDLLTLSEHVKDPICCQNLQMAFKLSITEWIVLVKAFLDYAESDGH